MSLMRRSLLLVLGFGFEGMVIKCVIGPETLFPIIKAVFLYDIL